MQLPATARRVENATEPRLNDRIRARTDAEVVRLGSGSDSDIAARLRDLDEEWDVERLLQVVQRGAWRRLGRFHLCRLVPNHACLEPGRTVDALCRAISG